MNTNTTRLCLAVAVASLVGCVGCAGLHSSRIIGSSTSQQTIQPTQAEPLAGPVNKNMNDYRKQRTAKALRGLRFKNGLVMVDTKAANALRQVETGLELAQAMSQAASKKSENDFTGTLSAYRWAILDAPTNAQAYEGLGDALIAKRKDGKALAAYRSAAALEPENIEIRMKLAETINRTGDLQGWAHELTNVLALEPNNGEAHARMAVAKHYLGDDDSARNEITLAEQLGGHVSGALKAMLAR